MSSTNPENAVHRDYQISLQSAMEANVPLKENRLLCCPSIAWHWDTAYAHSRLSISDQQVLEIIKDECDKARDEVMRGVMPPDSRVDPGMCDPKQVMIIHWNRYGREGKQLGARGELLRSASLRRHHSADLGLSRGVWEALTWLDSTLETYVDTGPNGPHRSAELRDREVPGAPLRSNVAQKREEMIKNGQPWPCTARTQATLPRGYFEWGPRWTHPAFYLSIFPFGPGSTPVPRPAAVEESHMAPTAPVEDDANIAPGTDNIDPRALGSPHVARDPRLEIDTEDIGFYLSGLTRDQRNELYGWTRENNFLNDKARFANQTLVEGILAEGDKDAFFVSENQTQSLGSLPDPLITYSTSPLDQLSYPQARPTGDPSQYDSARAILEPEKFTLGDWIDFVDLVPPKILDEYIRR